MGHRSREHSHVVLDEPLDFVVGVFVLAVFHCAVFELVVESRWAEQDDSPVNQKRKCHCSLAAPTAAALVISTRNQVILTFCFVLQLSAPVDSCQSKNDD